MTTTPADKVKCLKCQRLIWKKDVPKRCPASWTPRQESHVIELGYDVETMYPMPPYGVTDASWELQVRELAP